MARRTVSRRIGPARRPLSPLARSVAALLALALLAGACTTVEPDAEVAGDDDQAEDPQDDSADDPEAADGDEDGDEGDETVAERADVADLEMPEEFAEAPDLAEQVDAGDLPPVEERLPEAPMIVEPWEQIGEYGGDWRATYSGSEVLIARRATYEPWVRWNLEFDDYVPNVAEDVEIEDDGRRYIIHLREGMRWSDGEPFTSDDFMFAYHDFYLNDDLHGGTPAPGYISPEGHNAELSAPDDHTLVFEWPDPHGTFLHEHAGPHGALELGTSPRHYLEQFHIDYNPDVEELAEEEGYEDWVDLYWDHMGLWGQAYVDEPAPTLGAWVMQNDIEEGRVVFERNPYYYKIDTEGNQLPYLDRLVWDRVEDTEIATLRAAGGEIDYQDDHFTSLSNRPFLAEHRDEGDYEIRDLVSTDANVAGIALNLTHEDEALRDIFGDRQFREALSYAIDRQQIIDVVYAGQGEPFQVAPTPESDFFNEQLAYQHTDFDPERAAELLDEAGYEMGDGGVRVGPDGDAIRFTVDVVAESPDQVDVLDLVTDDWGEIGIDASINTVDATLAADRHDGNAHDAAMFRSAPPGDGAELLINPWPWVPMHRHGIHAMGWYNWIQTQWGASLDDSITVVDPPDELQENYRRWEDEVRATAALDEQEGAMERVFEVAADGFYHIGIAQIDSDAYAIQRNDFHNVPDGLRQASNRYPSPGPAMPEQFFTSRAE